MFKNFQELYDISCKINSSLNKNNLEHYIDLDRLIQKHADKIKLMRNKGKLVKLDAHFFKEKLLHDYIINNEKYFLSYDQNLEKIFIEDMKNNNDPYFNKWKLDHLEKISLYGWEKYSKILFDKLIG